MNDDSMVGPGMHEQAAQNMANNADAHRDLVNIEMDRVYPAPRER
jgi:hypothetical protein